MFGIGQDHRGVPHLVLGLENVLAPEGVAGMQGRTVVTYVQYFDFCNLASKVRRSMLASQL